MAAEPTESTALSAAPPRATVTVEEPATMNLLGLLLRSILERNLAQPAIAARATRLRGAVAVRGGQMRVTLRFEEQGITISRTPAPRPRARVEGSLAGFLDVALGRSLVGAWLGRRVSAKGNLFFLLRMLPLLRSTRPG
jgi:hypothetical protein